MHLDEKERIEIEWWQNSQFESPSAFTKENMLNKLQEAIHLNYKITKHINYISNKSNVLELGAGQGWASCYLKKYFLPNAHFTVTDISPYAIESLKYWEDLFKVQIDDRAALKSYEVDKLDKKFDLIFCYAAAHHFVEHNKTLAVLKNVLNPNGHILYFYEPTSSQFFYPLYYKYVNTAAHSTPEDVLVPRKMKSLAFENGLQCHHTFDPNQSINRSLVTTIYFSLLKGVPLLKRILPGSSDFIFEHVSS